MSTLVVTFAILSASAGSTAIHGGVQVIQEFASPIRCDNARTAYLAALPANPFVKVSAVCLNA